MDKRVYNAHSNIQKPWVMVKDMIRDIREGQDLAKRLTIRDIKALYRQSFLGLIWAFILPFANTITWVFLNGSGIVSLGETEIPYPIYVFTGTMIWAIFLESIQSPINNITTNKAMIAKVNFPREALIMSSVYQSLFNAAIKAAILLIVLAFMGYASFTSVLLTPIAIISLVICGTAIGLMLTPIGTLYTDISKGLPLVMQFFMYTTPVVYAIPETGLTAKIIQANPLTPLIMTCRDWITGQAPTYLMEFGLVNLAAVLILLFVMIVFRVSMPILVERMNA